MSSGLLRAQRPVYPDLTSALQANHPSKSEAKVQNHSKNSYDPIVDHVMRSRAFKVVVWSFIMALCAVGIAVVTLNAMTLKIYMYVLEQPDKRLFVLRQAGGPLIACVPVMTALILPFSRRLK